jgi:hypothetical protein
MIILKELKIGELFEINEKLAGLVPMAIPAEQDALTLSIIENGLKEPVVLWKNKIVDGRCRQKACKSAGVAVRAKDLDDELTEEEVSSFVKTVNTRRNLTTAQKIIVASKESFKPGSKSMSDISKSWGISRAILTMANYVSKNRPQFVEPLFNGLTVDIIDAKNNAVKTNKISAIHAHIKREEENVSKKSSYEWTADSHINTQAGKDWFYEFIKTNSIKNIDVMMELAHRANDKFKQNKNT